MRRTVRTHAIARIFFFRYDRHASDLILELSDSVPTVIYNFARVGIDRRRSPPLPRISAFDVLLLPSEVR